jgi:hypothetical protein
VLTREAEIMNINVKNSNRLAVLKLLLPNSFCIYNGTYIKLVKNITEKSTLFIVFSRKFCLFVRSLVNPYLRYSS